MMHFNWNTTLNQAMEKTGNKASFVLSSGDQIQSTKKKSPNKAAWGSEIEYSGYLSPDVLKNLPVATTVGNHDADNANYTYHSIQQILVNLVQMERSAVTIGLNMIMLYLLC